MASKLGACDLVRLSLAISRPFQQQQPERRTVHRGSESSLPSARFSSSSAPPLSSRQENNRACAGFLTPTYGLHPSNMIWSAQREARRRSYSLRTVQVSNGSPNIPRASKGATAGKSLTE